jgi:hypothetical protein
MGRCNCRSAGTSIPIYRCALQQTVSIVHEGRMVRLHRVDLAANAAARRTTAARPPEEDQGSPAAVFSAARLAFERDLSPVTDAEGGFVHPRAAQPPASDQPPRAEDPPGAPDEEEERS